MLVCLHVIDGRSHLHKKKTVVNVKYNIRV